MPRRVILLALALGLAALSVAGWAYARARPAPPAAQIDPPPLTVTRPLARIATPPPAPTATRSPTRTARPTLSPIRSLTLTPRATPTRPTRPGSPTPPLLDDLIVEVVALTNLYRVENGCPPLTLNARLSVAAQAHSADMAINDFFAHRGSDGSRFTDRLQRVGYRFEAAAENLTAGVATPAEAVAQWIESDAHRANLLACEYTEIGVGYHLLPHDDGDVRFGHYWTQVLARPE